MKKWVSDRIILFLTFLGCCDSLSCKDFGVRGHTFPIEEENFIEYFQRKFAGVDMSQKIKQIKEILFQEALIPVPISSLHIAKQPRSFFLDLSFKVDKDIENTAGAVVAKEGSIVNPLQKIKLSSGLLFFDGSNETHLAWARQQSDRFKWILVAGKPIDIEERENRPVYFDQKGAYTTRLQIKNIPAKVVQKGKYLFIEELVLKEDL